MKRTRLRSRPRSRGTDVDAAFRWFTAVTKGAKCVMCGRQHQLQAHHAIPQNVLRREFPYGVALYRDRVRPLGRRDAAELFEGEAEVRGLQEILWDRRNGVPLCRRCHEGHTSHEKKIPLSMLPAAVFVFARELGLQHRLSERFYG